MGSVDWPNVRTEFVGERPLESVLSIAGAVVFLSLFQSATRPILGIGLLLAIGAAVGRRNRGLLSLWLTAALVWYAMATPVPFSRFLSRLGEVPPTGFVILGSGPLLATAGYAVGRWSGTRRGIDSGTAGVGPLRAPTPATCN